MLDQFKAITTFIFDVDGVLTDGTVLVLDSGLQARRMSIKDGFALQMAVRNGYNVWIISGGTSPQVMDRLSKLGVNTVYMTVLNKKKLIAELIEKHGIKKEECLYMGDDLPDLPALELVGLSTCPADAVSEVREAVTYVSPVTGGNGCVREVIEKVLRLNGHWHYRDDVASR